MDQQEFFSAPAAATVPTLTVLDTRRRGTTFVEHDVKSIVNDPESTGMGFWSINPFVGCEFGCSYCYARYAHRYVVARAQDRGALEKTERPDGLDAFEQQIFVKTKTRVLAALERDLLRLNRRNRGANPETLVIGTATDPYQPAERRFRITRAVLEKLCSARGLSIGIITKSTLIARDIDVLRELGQHNRITIYVSLISVDPQLIRIFEPRSPLPHSRLRTLAKLRHANVHAGIIVAPVLPGITDSVLHIDALIRAAKPAKAAFIQPSVLRLDSAVCRRLMPIIEEHFPTLVPRYRAAFAESRHAPEPYINAVTRRFHRIARKHRIAAKNPLGSDAPAPSARQADTPAQLALL